MHSPLGVRQTVSSRNRLSSLNILACSSRSAQPLSRLPPNIGLRRFGLGPLGLSSARQDLPVRKNSELPGAILANLAFYGAMGCLRGRIAVLSRLSDLVPHGLDMSYRLPKTATRYVLYLKSL